MNDILIGSVVTHRRLKLTLRVERFIIGAGMHRLVACEVSGAGLEDDTANFEHADDEAREEFEHDEARRAAYDAWKAGRDRPTVDDLTLRGAAQWAQIVGDEATERQIDGVLADREARR